MRTLTALRALVAAASLAIVSSCVHAHPQAGVMYVSFGPPAPVVEVVTVAPSRAHVWIPGRYQWGGAAYAWIGGRFDVPPRGVKRYQPGRWEHNRAGWHWIDGRRR